jgi:hypothetical protein
LVFYFDVEEVVGDELGEFGLKGGFWEVVADVDAWWDELDAELFTLHAGVGMFSLLVVHGEFFWEFGG